MSPMVSQITSRTIVCSTVYSVADQRKHQSSASLAFVRGIHRWPVNSPHKGPVTRKMFPFDDVIMGCGCHLWLWQPLKPPVIRLWDDLSDSKIFCCLSSHRFAEVFLILWGKLKKKYRIGTTLLSWALTWGYHGIILEKLKYTIVQALLWRHNERHGVSNHHRLDCLFSRLLRFRSKKTSKLHVTGLCEGNSPVTGEFPAQRASNAQNVSIWWRHHVNSSKQPWLTRNMSHWQWG